MIVMLQDFQNIFEISITLSEVIFNISVAFICGLIISFFYRITYRGPGYSIAFINSLVVLSMITAVVIMVIGNNLARAFGLVGAMSIIRFRTAVKETQDIIYIFFSLAIGMAAGVGLHSIAIVGAIFVGTMSFILSKTILVSQHKQEYLLQFNYSADENSTEPPYIHVFKKYCKNYRIINTKSINGGILEVSYYVNLRHKEKSTEFVKEMKKLQSVNQINLFFDEEYF